MRPQLKAGPNNTTVLTVYLHIYKAKSELSAVRPVRPGVCPRRSTSSQCVVFQRSVVLHIYGSTQSNAHFRCVILRHVFLHNYKLTVRAGSTQCRLADRRKQRGDLHVITSILNSSDVTLAWMFNSRYHCVVKTMFQTVCRPGRFITTQT